MPVTKIVLVNGSKLIRETLKRAVGRTDGLEVVREFDSIEAFQNVPLEKGTFDWIILALPPDKNLKQRTETLLEGHLSAKVLVIVQDGQQIQMSWLEERKKIVEDISLPDLISILQSHEKILA